MNRSRKWLALPALWLAAASLPAAPIPARSSSQGPISDALALRGLLTTTTAPLVKKIVMPDDATVEVHNRVLKPVEVEEIVNRTVYVQEVREVIVKKDGRDVKVAVTQAV